MVLELADAFGHGPPPARTLVFLLVTGEEIGLLGTTYYLDHPAVPLDRTLANVNFEMVGRPDALVGGAGRLWLTGYERTTLGPEWSAAGLAIAPDARPEEHFYERSDNIAFVERGIVGQTLSSYDLHEDYHTVADEPDTLDYRHMEAAARLAYAACRMLADGVLAPRWNETEAGAEPAAPDAPPAAAPPAR
jgi:Zn-dependent M28 family amino/carboxypeptidase